MSGTRKASRGMTFTSVGDLSNLCKTKQFDEALMVANSMDQQGIPIPRDAIYSLLLGCANKKDLRTAKKIHTLMVSNKLDKISVLADHLIRLFVSCGSLVEADQVFRKVSKPSMYTWNAILTAHSKLGDKEIAFELFHQMQQSGLKPDRITMLCMLKACRSSRAIEEGRLLHNEICRGALGSDMILGSALIDMYAKCGSLEDARSIFDELPCQDVVAWGAMIAGYAQHGNGFTAIQLFETMQSKGISSNDVIFSSVLKACGSIGAIEEGKLLHGQIIEFRLDLDFIVGSSLVDMYSKCRSVQDAHKVFKTISCRDAVVWGSIIAGYTQCGHDQLALDMFEEMLLEDIKPSKPMFLCVLKAGSSLGAAPQSRAIHDQLIRIGLESDPMLANAMIDMYAKCGVLGEALKVFDGMRKRDVVSWSALMAGYAEHGNCLCVIELFQKMQQDGISPDRVAILCTLKSCASSGDIAQGRTIHNHIDKCGLKLDLGLGNALIDMYSKCGSLVEARTVFDELESRDDMSWGAMLSGYAQHGHGFTALELFKEMLDEGIEPGKVMLLSSLKACSSIVAIFEGRLLHDQIIKSELMLDLDIGSALINMYAKCGCLEEANSIFNELPSRDIVVWGAIISAYSEHGDGLLAVELFEKMQEEGINPNEPILLCILKACGNVDDIALGRLIHHQILKNGLESNVSVGNFLIGMYAKCQSLEEACQVFDALRHQDEMSWDTMIAGYIQHGHQRISLDLFGDQGGFMPGRGMFVCMLKACSSMLSIEQGRLVHFQVIRSGFEKDLVVGSTLIDMYAKCGSLEEAYTVFDILPARDLVTYSTMIIGLVQYDQCIPALELYNKLQEEGLHPDKYVLLWVLKICGTLGAIRQGMQIHEEIVKDELELDAAVRTALVDMYTKCASLEEAQKVFDEFTNCDVFSWGAIVAGHAQHGNCRQALQCLEQMQRQGVRPTERMFSSILAACSHKGLLDEGYHCFKSMTEEYNITLRGEHLNCMIDLFGRAGHLDEAADFLEAMPTCPDIIGWRSLLAGCRTYGNTELGRRCFDHIVQLQPSDGSGFILMSNICAEASMWEDAKKMQAWRKSASAPKKAEFASLEVSNMVHEFIAGGENHPQNDDAYSKLDRLNAHIKTQGFMPHLNVCVGQSVDEEYEDVLRGYSERGALACGLISTPEGTSLQVTKNSQVCYGHSSLIEFAFINMEKHRFNN